MSAPGEAYSLLHGKSKTADKPGVKCSFDEEPDGFLIIDVRFC
jgi:hypothetical protein